MQPMEFDTREDAQVWMEEAVDDPCIDNDRFAFVGDEEAVNKYDRQMNSGCCGSFDAEIIVAGKPALIGCNYGH